jgi:hypothetical protein
MNEPHPAQAVLDDVLIRLQLCQAGEDKAYGEVQGSPVTMTVLGVEPLALLLGFKIQSPHPSQIELPEDIDALVQQNKADISLERGIAWLSLDDLTEETGESIEGLVKSFANRLAQANVRLPDGCVQCKSTHEVELAYSDGRCSRLCANCRDRIVAEQLHQEAELNRPSLLFAMALPVMFVYVAGAWTVLWLLVDTVLTWLKMDWIVLRIFDVILLLPLLAVIALLIGYPIGVFLRRSGLPGRGHWFASTATVVAACVAGEWLYLTAVIYRQTGLIEPMLAARLFMPLLSDYHPTWLAIKGIVAIAIGISCHCAAKVRKTAAIEL